MNVTQLGKDEEFDCGGSPRTTHDRPPLLVELGLPGLPGRGVTDLAVLAVHGRSFLPSGSTCDSVNFAWAKRLEQAESTAQMVQDFQTSDPGVPLVVIGDFNDFEFTDGHVDVVGQIAGTAEAADNELSFVNFTDPPLEILTLRVPAEDRYSYVFDGSAQTLDHALVNQAGRPLVSGIEYGRGNADSPRFLEEDGCTGSALFGDELRASDHDGLVVYLQVPDALIFADGFESGDTGAW